jgi:SAM-dependent methyltransferase
VAERVDVKNGDARQVPFADGAFDVVVTKEALHNIYNAAERDTAVREIARVLRPGGRLFLSGVRHTGHYIQVLQECGLEDLRRSAESVPSMLVGAISFGFGYPCRFGRIETEDRLVIRGLARAGCPSQLRTRR